MQIINDVQLDFDDVLIRPQTTTINHRAEVEIVDYFDNNDVASILGTGASNRRAHVSIWRHHFIYITGKYMNHWPTNNLHFDAVVLAQRYIIAFDGSHASVNGKYESSSIDYRDDYSTIYTAIFGQSATNTTRNSITPAKFKLYSLWMKDDTNEINLVPVLSPNSKACMYDKTNKKLFCNQGSGEFITN